MKISTRLMLLIAALSTLLVATGAAGLYGVSRTNDVLKSVYDDRLVCLTQLDTISALMLRNRLILANTVLDPTPDAVRKYTDELDANITEVTRQWDAYMGTYLTEAEAVQAKRFAEARSRFVKEGLLATKAALLGGEVDQARQLLLGPVRQLFDATRDSSQALVQIQLDEAKRDYEEAQARYATMRWAAVLLIVAGVVTAVTLGLLLLKGVQRSLAEATQTANAVARGDLTRHIEVNGKDEVAQVLVALAAMRDSLARVVSTVRENSESVATASAQIAQGNQDLSGRTEQQASALQQTAATMEQLGTTVRHNVDSARQANQLAQSASDVAARGGQVVAQVVSTMRGINDSSRKITDIISVIDDIAFQTNILALNAAVEAARAGEQGRGFAVVAGEVRTLAQRSAEAAREIKGLIGQSVDQVEQGSALVDNAGKTMHDIVDAIRRVTDIVGEISSASEEQSSGVLQVGQAMSQMDQATQQNAALVEQSAAAAESLHQQSQQLVQVVAAFRLAGA